MIGVLPLAMILTMMLAGCPQSAVHHQSDSRPNSTKPDLRPNTTPRLPDGIGGVKKVGKPYQIDGRWYTPVSQAHGYDSTGTASWYGRDFHGKKTANGELYDMHTLSAAHKTLPLPTLVRVTNLDNGRSVIVRINDRGPFVKNRLIDLSWAAARELGYDVRGTARVRVQTLDTLAPQTSNRPTASAEPFQHQSIHTPTALAGNPAPLELQADATTTKSDQAAGSMYIQLGAYGQQQNAIKQQSTLKPLFPTAHLLRSERDGQPLFKLRIGPFNQHSRIEQAIIKLKQQGYNDSMVISE